MAREPKEQFCEFCGESLGVYVKPAGEHDTCGKLECDRWARDEARAEREEAHHQLDIERGWDGF